MACSCSLVAFHMFLREVYEVNAECKGGIWPSTSLQISFRKPNFINIMLFVV